jgi:hypothetical protein
MDMPERQGLQSFLQNAFKKYGGVTTGTEQGMKLADLEEHRCLKYLIQRLLFVPKYRKMTSQSYL